MARTNAGSGKPPRGTTGTPGATPTGGVGLRDVARAVGVSTATVSRAINRPEVVSPELRERIALAVAELGWIPDGRARAFTTGRSQTIGAVFPTLALGDFPRAANAIQRQLLTVGYTLLLACSEYDPEQEFQQVRKFAERGVDGVILVGRAHHPDLVPFLRQHNLPFVSSFIYEPDSDGSCVGPDNHKALVKMTDYLADLGHVRFAAIAQATENNDRASARLAGIRDALAMRGLAVRPQHLAIGTWTIEEGRRLFSQLMATDPPPTAIICGNAPLAVGAMLEALETGRRVPEEVSIVGYDDIEIMSHLPVPVTTVRVPGEEIGYRAARLIVDRVEQREPDYPLESEAEIVVRASSGPPPID
jgi:LacI family transcriptional regulator